MQTSENVKCLVLPCSERTLAGESKILNETKFVGETQSNIMYLCSSRAFVRQQVVTKLATNFTTRLTRQDHRPGHRYNDGADSSQQKKARCTISSQALEHLHQTFNVHQLDKTVGLSKCVAVGDSPDPECQMLQQAGD